MAKNLRPVMLYSSGNSYQDEQRERQLERERLAILRLFRPKRLVPDTWPDVVIADPEEQAYIFDLIRQRRFDPAVQVFHLAGFSMGEHLHLMGGFGEEALQPHGVAQLLSRLPGLHLVILNGCATPPLLNALLRKDIPAIFATQEKHERSDLIDVIYRLYSQLLEGIPLGAAFQQAIEPSHVSLDLYPVRYDLGQDCFIWPGKNGNDTVHGGLYYQADLPGTLTWCLNLPSASPDHTAFREIKHEAPKRKRTQRSDGGGPSGVW